MIPRMTSQVTSKLTEGLAFGEKCRVRKIKLKFLSNPVKSVDKLRNPEKVLSRIE